MSDDPKQLRNEEVSVPFRGIGSEKPSDWEKIQDLVIDVEVSVPFRGIGSEKQFSLQFREIGQPYEFQSPFGE